MDTGETTVWWGDYSGVPIVVALGSLGLVKGCPHFLEFIWPVIYIMYTLPEDVMNVIYTNEHQLRHWGVMR